MSKSARRTPLKRAIFEAGVAQRDLAEAVGLHESQLSRLVNDLPGVRITAEIREAIATELTRLDQADRVWTVPELFPTAVVAAASA